MPPIKKTYAVHRVHYYLNAVVKSGFLAIPDWRIMENHFHSVMPHISAHIYGELQKKEIRSLKI